MPFILEDLLRARKSLYEYREKAVSPHHERFSFPFFSGTYFTYRKIDVLRLVSLAKSVAGSDIPSFLDVGCGYGDFLSKIREYLPRAEGIEIDSGIFYGAGIAKPEYIHIQSAGWLTGKYDIVFVGWMEPGQDFRTPVAKLADVIVTTLDQGLSLAAEFDGHGFERIAWWRTPSWEDVNIEIMNKYYTSELADAEKSKHNNLHSLRGAHNLWYVYSKPQLRESVVKVLQKQAETENPNRDNYDFESVLDGCGFGYLESLKGYKEPLWKIQFD